MPRKTKSYQGKRISVWLPPESRKVAEQIDNLSGFFQLALKIAPDIMAWDILNEEAGGTLDTGRRLENEIETFNERHPLDPLTAKRKNPEWQKNSPSKSELW